MPRSLERARDDLRNGRPWRARDRLESYVSQQPLDVEALELLGDVLFDMGDLPRAARYWLLTQRDDVRFDAAYGALREVFPRPDHLLAVLPIRPPLSEYPDVARGRIERLVGDAAAIGVVWEPRPRRHRGDDLGLPQGLRAPWWLWPIGIGCLVLFVAVVVIGVTGLVEIVFRTLDEFARP
jgi:hypothetical protein